MLTIDKESKSRARLPIEIDNMANRYQTENGYFTFPSPSLETIEKNYFYLLRNSIHINFNSQYKYKPDYFSFDEYGTVALDYLIMYMNNVFCMEDFDLKTIIVPTFDAIVNICQDRVTKPISTEDLDDISW